MEQLKITGYTQMADLLNVCDVMVDVHGVAMTHPARARRSSRSCCLTLIGPPRRWLGLQHLPYRVTTVETPRYKENLHDVMGYMCLQKNWGDNVPPCTARPHYPDPAIPAPVTKKVYLHMIRKCGSTWPGTLREAYAY
jgi:hypothetical protein